MTAPKQIVDFGAAGLRAGLVDHLREHAGLDVLVLGEGDVVLPREVVDLLGPSTASEVAAAIGRSHSRGRFALPTEAETAEHERTAQWLTRNPFAKKTFNLTEQIRLKAADPKLAALLQARAAEG